jgi:glycosyltransferase involved in cell wall biosynthesis
MKILHITASYKPAFIYGGPIYSVSALCEALVKSADRSLKSESPSSLLHNVEVITTLANGKEEHPYPSGALKIVEGVPVRYFKRLTKDHSHFSPALLWHLWKTAKTFDVIHIHSWWNLVSMGSVLICIIKGIKPIVSPRGMLGNYTFSKGKTLFHNFIGKYLLRKCDFHATTMMEAEEIALRIGKAEIVDLMEWKSRRSEDRSRKSILPIIYVLHNIVKQPKILPEKIRLFDGTLKLIFLSRIHPKKGIELLLDALAEVQFPFSLSIVGEGATDYVESLKLKVESLKLSQAVKWIGAVYGDEKFKLLAEHDLLVLPSYNENFANVVIESLAVGTPVLISEHVGLKNYIEDNNFGKVFKLKEIKSDMENFYQLLSDGKFEISTDRLVNSRNLIELYQKMYVISSNF